MPYCTIVEFERDETFDYGRFASIVGGVSGEESMRDGRLSHIVGIDNKGARMIEVWQSGEDAKAFAEKSAPFLAEAELRPPSRVVGFEVTAYVVS